MDTDALFRLSSLQTDATSKVSHRHCAGPWWGWSLLLVGGWPLVKHWAGTQETED